jgi:RNA-directed DNA polymerase
MIVRGRANYYGSFYPHELVGTLKGIDVFLVRWATRKYKRLRRRPERAWKFLAGVYAREPGLFAHWRLVRPRDWMVGAG